MKGYNQSVKGKLFKYFEGRLSIKKSTNNWWRCDCMFCGGNYSFGVNLELPRAKCFKCGESKNPIGLLMFLEGFEIYNQAKNFLNIQQEYEAYDRLVTQDKVEYKQIELPEGYRLITRGDNMIAKAARHYIKKRGFSVNKLALAGVGYCDKGEYDGYIIFPYYYQGNLVYYQGRLFMGSGTKMKNPAEEEFGVGKSNIIYNEDALYIYNRVYVVESITNALTLGDPAISLSGKKASTNQISAILKSPCRSTIIILDPDALKEALELSLKLVWYKKTKVVQLPDHIKISGKLRENDINTYGREKTIQLVKKEHYKKYTELWKQKINL